MKASMTSNDNANRQQPAARTAPPGRVVRIDGYELACALPEVIGNSRVFFDSRRALVIAITTADGTVGWGETWAMPAAASAVIRDSLGRAVLGMDVHGPRRIWDAMERTLGYDRRGVTHMAFSAIDLAVWDAAARSSGVSIAALLGGALRDKVAAYVSGPFLKPGPDPYRDFDADIDSYLKAGFRAIKMRMGVSPRTDGERLRRVRDRVGADFPLMVDLNEGASLRSALVFGEAFRESQLVWLEEPIAHDNLDGYVRLSRALPMALAGGESLFGLGAFRDYVSRGALEIAQPDLALCGGFSEGLRIAALCQAFDVPVVLHVWGTGINFAAALQFSAILPPSRAPGFAYPMFEFDYSDNPLRDAFGSFGVAADGTVPIPQGPGLGIDIDVSRFEHLVTGHWTVEA
jgi:D-galactarolactone cycloisomerase